MDDHFILILGNGFTQEVINWINTTASVQIDSSKPFSLKIQYLGNPKITLMSKLPKLQQLLSQHTTMNDYELIRWFKKTQNDLETYSQMRQYLAIGYSTLSQIISKNWQTKLRWENWFQKYQKNIEAIISFNYDLSIETLLSKNNIKYFRISTEEDTDTPKGIPIFKPHGSCDFECPDNTIGMPDLDNRMTGSRYRVDSGSPKILSLKEQLEPRITPDIIVPFENNYQLDISWVRAGYSQIVEKMKEADSCIIYGLDYHEVDRPEINFLISNMPRNSRFIHSSLKNKKDLEKEISKKSSVINHIDYKIEEDFNKLFCNHKYQIIVRKKKYTVMKCELCGKLLKQWN